jgi:hypothetical protein
VDVLAHSAADSGNPFGFVLEVYYMNPERTIDFSTEKASRPFKNRYMNLYLSKFARFE